jgi:4-amino-4-deoxy-L-arabinose transferase-like glycosyltransferase
MFTGESSNRPSTGEQGGAAADTTMEPALQLLPGGERFALVVLVAFSLFTSFAGLSGGPQLGDHECINAESARQTIQSGQWLVPRVGEIPRVRKTPLGIWLIAGASRIFDDPAAAAPVSEFTARLPSALAGLGTTLVLFWLGRMMFGCLGGLVAGFIWAGSAAAIIASRTGTVDMVLTFFTALSFACFWRGISQTPTNKWFLATFYAAFAMAMMSKAPLPLATVGVALALYWLVTVPVLAATEGPAEQRLPLLQAFGRACKDQFKCIPSLWFFPGVALFVVLAGAWPLYVFVRVPNAAELWRNEYVEAFLSEQSRQSAPFWYYVPVIFAVLAPYTLSVPESVAATFLPRYRLQRRGLAFALTWAAWGIVFLGVNATKRWHYSLSTLPAFCLLLAPVIERLFFGAYRGNVWLNRLARLVVPPLIGIGAVAAGVWVYQKYPSMLWSYAFIAALLVLAWSLAVWSFTQGRRRAAFALLNLGVLILLVLSWPTVGEQVRVNAASDALAAGFREHGITPRDDIFLVDSRPDSSIEFYHGYRIQRVMNELELAGLGRRRYAMSAELYAEMGERIARKLQEDHPVYLILKAENYSLLKQNLPVACVELFRVKGFDLKPGRESVVITQASRPATTGPASRPSR